ncbi:DNA gyrase subunit A [uncultured Ruminococcus sp.]|uniref:DNA gyrase subunit A n=1 Tax=Huintestinicola butyrica TaxID=2981728 RepID=UPI00082108F1|nr:DNA gyrase subunit A [Huintestinicola butyrica]MCU6727772.1 DNA gyrase subunit A [Huintestinicola butyrica]SCI92587.1 DNA gyrase subunit A [uncultured Ruminococcus sp.]
MSDENFSLNNNRVVHRDIEKEMRESFLAYSMSVIVSRALPDVRDGLKPVHRRILYTMYENGLTPDKEYRKCADTVGTVLGRYHPHGDASVYDAMVRLAQDFSMRYPLVDGHGNFGSLDGDPPAAYRYTEARMDKMALDMLTDINKDTIDYMSNYDDRLKEPVVLPSRFPNLLVNGSVGIAVGMATNIPPHNLTETIDAVQTLIKNPDCTLDELMQHIKGPDFPTGGIIMGRAGIRAAYATGRGRITLRGRAKIEDIKNRTCIIIEEIPYMVNKKRLIENIADLAKDKRIDGIHTIRDESDKDHDVRIVIELKKDAIAQVVLNHLYQYTQLQDTVGVIMLALVKGEPKILSLKQMLTEYIDFQVEVIRRRTKFDLDKAQARAHILEGMVIAAENIEEVIRICRTSENITEIKQRLMARFSLTEIQADAIAQMRMYQLSNMERKKIDDELAELNAKIKDLTEILASHERVLEIICNELEEIKRKYGDERRTSIENVSGEVDVEDLIPVEDCVVTLTNIGYIKRQPISEYKTQKRGGKGVSAIKQRDEDFIQEMFISSTHDDVLFITSKGIMYKLRCYEIAEGSKQSRGVNVINMLPLAEDEKIAAMIKTTDYEDGKFLIMVTKNGKIKRTPLSAYKNVRKNGLRAVGLDDGDEIAGVRLTDGSAQVIVATRNGYAIRIDETQMRPMSRTAHGVKAIKLRDGDYVVSIARVREGASVLTVTDKGLGRRVKLDDYRIQNRGGYGMLNYKVSDDKGYVCGIKIVDEGDDIIMIATDGVIIRIRACDIRIMGRYATGVKLMRVSGEDRVVAFTRAEHDDSAETEKIEQPSEEELEKEMAEAAAEEQNEVVIDEAPDDDEDDQEDTEE